MKERERIDLFLKNNARKMVNPEFYFSVDNNGEKAENFTDDKLKILCCFLSRGERRSASNTFNALYYLAHEELGDNVFIDCCSFPEDKNKKILQENEIPYFFGNVSHAPVRDYDLVFLSLSIMMELVNVPHALEYSGIPLTIQEREKDSDLPFIVFGGAGAVESGILFGPIYRDGKCLGNSLVDIANYGHGEYNIPKLARKFYELKKSGVDIRNKPMMKEMMIEEGFLKDYLFYPDKYEWVYGNDRFRILEFKRLDERVPERVLFNRIKDDNFRGFPLQVLNLTSDYAGVGNIMISSGCSGQSSCCTFCMEATVEGNYWERSLGDVEKDMAYVRKTAAPNSMNWFSFNLNYYYRFMDLLATSADYFKSVNLMNERMDIIAHSPEQIELASRIGMMRMSGAIEGMGERMRNEFFNKNLSRETLMKAVRNIFSVKMMKFKAGLIYSGQERDEDVKEFLSEVDEILKIRSEMGVGTAVQFNITPLIFYSSTPIRWYRRVTAEESFYGVRNLADLVAECQKRGVRMKINGKGPVNWMEQLLVDFGPAGTDFLVGATIDRGVHYDMIFSSSDKTKFVEELAKRNYNDPLFFTKERDEGWIFPNVHVKFAEDELLKDWYERFKIRNFNRKLCLRTPANLNPKCYDCGACPDISDRVRMVKRKLESKYTLDEVVEKLSSHRHLETIRIAVRMKPEWYLYDREPLSHYITAQFLQRSEIAADAFYAVGNNTSTWISNHSQKGWVGGVFAFDIELKKRIGIQEFKKSINEINENLESCQILDIYPDCKDIPIKRNSLVTYIGECDKYSLSQIKDKVAVFDWNIIVAAKAIGLKLETSVKPMPELKESLLFVPKGSKVLIAMCLPATVNPYLVMASIMKTSNEKALDSFRFDVLDSGFEVESTCKCGRNLTYSIIKNKHKNRCPVCESKLILAKLTGRI